MDTVAVAGGARQQYGYTTDPIRKQLMARWGFAWDKARERDHRTRLLIDHLRKSKLKADRDRAEVLEAQVTSLYKRASAVLKQLRAYDETHPIESY